MVTKSGNSTLGAGSDFTAQGPARGFRSGDRDDNGMKMGGAERAGLFDGGIGGFFRGGGLLGGILGGGQQFGYTDPQGNRVSALQDMINGGGAGMAGDTFQGGLLSGLLNTVGVRPAGYRARQAAMQMGDDNAPSIMAPSPASGASPSSRPLPASTDSRTMAPAETRNRYSAIRTPTLTQADIDALDIRGAAPGTTMTPQEYLELQAARTQIDYGPRAPAPSAMTTAPMQPGMNVMPDNGETFLRQDIAVVPALSNPMATTPQTDPRVSRSYRTMVPPTPQIQGFRPFPDTTPPRPVNPASLPAGSTYIPANQFTRNASSAYRDMQLRALAAQGLLPQ